MAVQEIEQREREIQAACLSWLALRLELERAFPVDSILLDQGVPPLAAAAIEGVETEVIWGDGEHEVFNASKS